MNALTSSVVSLAEKHFGMFTIRNGEVIPKLCPFCNGGDDNDMYTFAVSMHNGSFNCKRGKCGASGSFKQLSNFFGEIPGDADASIPFMQNTVKKKSYSIPNESELNALTDDAVTYFATRKISEDTLNDFKISTDKQGNIVFPFYRDGKLIFEKFRKPKKHTREDGPKEWAMANGEPILFGMDMVVKDKPLYITEGEIDALSLYEAGVRNVVSVPMGCNNMEWITLCWDWIESFSEIILFGDSDEPGIEMVQMVMKRLGEDRCMIIKEYPEFMIDGKQKGRLCKDANEILYCYGEDELRRIAATAEPAPIKGIIELASIAYVDPSMVPRIYTKVPELDGMIGGLEEGGLTVFTGKRGNGKSTFSGQLLLNAVQQNYTVCAYSGELSASKFSDWILTQACEDKYIGVKQDAISGKNYTFVSPEIRQRINEWLENKFYLFDNTHVTEDTQTDTIIKAFTMCARRFGAKLFLVDNLMSCLTSSEEEEYKAQAKFAAALKAFAVKFKAHVILIAHPRKTKAGEAINNDDISGSSATTNLADNVIVSEKPNLRVIKNRSWGTTGLIYCDFNPANRRVYETTCGDRTVYGWNHENVSMPDFLAKDYPEFHIQTGAPQSSYQPF